MTDSNIKPPVVLPRHVFPILQSGAARRILSAQIYGEKTKVTKVEGFQTCAWVCNMLWTVVSPGVLPEHKQEVNRGSSLVT